MLATLSGGTQHWLCFSSWILEEIVKVARVDTKDEDKEYALARKIIESRSHGIKRGTPPAETTNISHFGWEIHDVCNSNGL